MGSPKVDALFSDKDNWIIAPGGNQKCKRQYFENFLSFLFAEKSVPNFGSFVSFRS